MAIHNGLSNRPNVFSILMTIVLMAFWLSACGTHNQLGGEASSESKVPLFLQNAAGPDLYSSKLTHASQVANSLSMGTADLIDPAFPNYYQFSLSQGGKSYTKNGVSKSFQYLGFFLDFGQGYGSDPLGSGVAHSYVCYTSSVAGLPQITTKNGIGTSLKVDSWYHDEAAQLVSLPAWQKQNLGLLDWFLGTGLLKGDGKKGPIGKMHLGDPEKKEAQFGFKVDIMDLAKREGAILPSGQVHPQYPKSGVDLHFVCLVHDDYLSGVLPPIEDQSPVAVSNLVSVRLLP